MAWDWLSVTGIGFVQRFGQVFLESALTLVVGIVTASVFRRMVGMEATRRLFGRGARGLWRGWLAGMLLPVCSLGVIPVARELRRAGVPSGTVLSFVLAAPLLNPISFLYGLTLAEPTTIGCFIAASLAVSTGAGWLWDRVFDRGIAVPHPADEPTPQEGLRRLLAVAVTAAKETWGASKIFYLAGWSGSALLAAVIPNGALQTTMAHDDPTAPLLMSLIAVPIYSSPLPGMQKIGLMFDHGNSVGAAFVLFTLGLGLNVGLWLWTLASFGRRLLVWWAAVFVVIIGLAYLSEPILFPEGKRQEDHTHAFDDYCCPFASGSSGELWGRAGKKLAEQFGPMEQAATTCLIVLTIGAWLTCRWNRDGRLERWLTSVPSKPTSGWWNVPVPGRVLGLCTILGLIVFSVIGAYVYYPPIDQSLTELAQYRTEVILGIRLGKSREAILDLERLDDTARRLEVGAMIRRFRYDPDAARCGQQFREAIEALRDHLLAGDVDAARSRLSDFDARYAAFRHCYRP
jgi:uncharacterized membrane protein YraQ (UPF0718 family)